MLGRFMLRDKPVALQWAFLLATSLVCIVLLELIRLPAALLLGSMIAAILLSVQEGKVTVPLRPYILAQALIGCLVARSIGADIFRTLFSQLPVFLAGVFAVLVFAAVLGGLLARWQVLPGATAIWGSMPGAATVMMLMSEAFGADIRLVAFMQFLRVVLVAAVASIIARIWIGHTGVLPSIEWFPAINWVAFAETLLLVVVSAIVGIVSKIPAGALLVPLFAGAFFSGEHWVSITLPPWLMACSYALLGWSIGLRFTRDVVIHAAQAFPRVVLAILMLLALCGALGYVLHLVMGVDILSAYLATSPGGADSIAIIAASTKVDLPFVMAMQMARFLLVMALGPTLAKLVTRLTGTGKTASSES